MTRSNNEIINGFNAVLGLFSIGVLMKKNLHKTKEEQRPSNIKTSERMNQSVCRPIKRGRFLIVNSSSCAQPKYPVTNILVMYKTSRISTV